MVIVTTFSLAISLVTITAIIARIINYYNKSYYRTRTEAG